MSNVPPDGPLGDSEVVLDPLESDDYPVSLACFQHMRANGYDPDMPVYRAIVSPAFMAKTKALRPDVANTVQLLFGPFGIVGAPEEIVRSGPNGDIPMPFRVAELQVGTVVIDVEDEYEWADEPPAAP